MKNRIQKDIEKLAANDASFDKKIKALRPDWFTQEIGRGIRYPKGCGKSGTLVS